MIPQPDHPLLGKRSHAEELLLKRNNSRVYILFLLPALAGLLFGFAISAASGALGSDDTPTGGQKEQINLIFFKNYKPLVEAFTSINLAGAAFGSLIVLQIGDQIGRKGALMISAILYGVGSLVIVVTPHPSSVSWDPKFLLFVGQVIYGIGIGFAMHSAPLYISEISPSSIRGLLVSLKEEAIVIGILLGFAVSYPLDLVENGWRYIFCVPIFLSIILFVGLIFAPRSPRLVLLQNSQRKGTEKEVFGSSGEEAARKILKFLMVGYPDSEVEKEIQDVKDSLSETLEAKATMMDLFKGATWPALKIGIVLVILQQITGQPSVLAYAPQVFRDAGFGDNAVLASVGVGVVKMIATGISVAYVDSFGRRPLLLIGIAGMLLSLVVLAVSFQLNKTDDGFKFTPAWGAVTLVTLMVYVSFYQVGFGPIVWLLQSEIFPLHTRSKAQSVAVIANFLSNALVGLTFLSLNKALTPTGAYGLFASLCALSFGFVFFYLPETKGKTLEQIQSIFKVRSLLQ